MTMKVCFITNQYAPQWSGVARSAYRIVSGLAKQGYSICVIAPSDDQDPMDASFDLHLTAYLDNPEIDVNGVKVYRIPKKAMSKHMSDLIEFIQLLDFQENFDLFHGFWLPLAFPLIPVASRRKRPVIASIRGADAVRSLGLPARFPFIRTVLERAQWITSVSSDLLDSMNSIYPLSNRSSVIFNGIDAIGFPRWTSANKVLGLVGTSGELRYKKGIGLLVKAFASANLNFESKLRLIGPFSDPVEEKLTTDLVKTLKIDSRYFNSGWMDRKALLNEISKFNIFVIPSYHDGMPNALLEALACGLPIIASRVGGMADILTHNENALLVNPGNEDELKMAIQKLLNDESLQNRLSEGALALASRMNVENEISAWSKLYLKMVSDRLKNINVVDKKCVYCESV